MSFDYSGLSTAELQANILEAQKALETRKETEKAELKAEVLELVQSRGFTIDELFDLSGKPKKKGKLAPTHRDPSNPENTWSGRGRKPKWLSEAIENGASIDDFVIVS